jgi:hypothetical protein
MVRHGLKGHQVKLGLCQNGRGARTASLMLALVAGAVACGARSEPDGEPGGYGPLPGGPEAGASSVPDATCVVCDGQIECGHCLIEAYEWTYRCTPSATPPDGECWDLRELHVDQYGRSYTCYYCP